MLDVDLADELFGRRDSKEERAVQRQIWEQTIAGLQRDLGKLEGLEPEARSKELHRIRGYAVSCGLSRLSVWLRQWEEEPESDDPEWLKKSGKWLRESQSAMEARYPVLRDRE